MFELSCIFCCTVFFFKQKTAYERRISDWGSDVCSSDLQPMHAALGLEPAIGIVALDLDRGGFDARLLAGRFLDQLGLEAAQVGTARVDRKSVVEGKRVSASVNLGGCCTIKKKRPTTNVTIHHHNFKLKTIIAQCC